MKLFLTTIFFCLLLAQKTKGQEYYINNILENYYRFNPFNYDFSFFFNELRSDPGISDKSLHKRTDSSLFSFQGHYTNFMQGNLKFTNAEVRLEEIEIDLRDSLHSKDTLLKKDTLIQYQITCYCIGKPGLNIVKKAFADFDHDYHVAFTQGVRKEIKENNTVNGMIINYFSYSLPVSPLTIAWSKLNDDESIFVIMVRLKLKQDQLILYRSADKKGFPIIDH